MTKYKCIKRYPYVRVEGRTKITYMVAKSSVWEIYEFDSEEELIELINDKNQLIEISEPELNYYFEEVKEDD